MEHIERGHAVGRLTDRVRERLTGRSRIPGRSAGDAEVTDRKVLDAP